MDDRRGIIAIDSFENNKPEPSRNSWLPIESCPRDGTKVLLIGNVYHGVPFVGYWDNSVYNPNRPWVCVVNDHRMYEHGPTHWMIVPPKPLNT